MDEVPTDPEVFNSEAKSVEGVDGKDSVRSSIGPPVGAIRRGGDPVNKGEEQEERARLV